MRRTTVQFVPVVTRAVKEEWVSTDSEDKQIPGQEESIAENSSTEGGFPSRERVRQWSTTESRQSVRTEETGVYTMILG